jgi:hypothetical protein
MMNHVVLYPVTNLRSRLLGCTIQSKDHWLGFRLGISQLKKYIDTLKDKDIAILIPGCGNTYEAAYLLEQGFTNVTVIDIAPTLVKNIEQNSLTIPIQVLLVIF